MPYIKVQDGVMQEYDHTGLNTGPVASIGLNAYNYLERRNWSATEHGGTGPSNPDYPEDFAFLQSKGIKYLQVMMAPFSGTGDSTSWNVVVGGPRFNNDNSVNSLNINQTYWNAVQAFLDAAQAHDIGIIACPFWNIKAIPALVGDTNAALSVANSKSRNYMRAFAAAFAARFKDHVGIAGWMAGQEITLNTGLNYDTAPPVLQDVAQAIRTQDTLQRMISSGNAALPHTDPRTYTIDQYLDIVVAMNPSPIDTLCENLFLGSEYFSSGVTPVAGRDTGLHADFTSCSLPYLKMMQKLASDKKKPYYVGSFGLTTTDEGALNDTTQHNLSTLLDNFCRTGVQLASHWVWNSGNIESLKPWNVLVTATGTGNVRAEVFDAILAKLDRSRMAPPDDLVTRQLNTPRFDKTATFSCTRQQSCQFTIPANATLKQSKNFSVSYTINQTALSLQTEGTLIRHTSGSVNLDACGWTCYKNGGSNDSNIFMQLYSGVAYGAGDAGNRGHSDAADTWTRITFTVDAMSGIALYVNDFLMAYKTPTEAWTAAASSDIQVGRGMSANASWRLSDLILYDRVLTPQEVFDYGVTGNAVNPAGRWKLDGSFQDSSGNNNHGVYPTVNNSVTFG